MKKLMKIACVLVVALFLSASGQRPADTISVKTLQRDSLNYYAAQIEINQGLAKVRVKRFWRWFSRHKTDSIIRK